MGDAHQAPDPVEPPTKAPPKPDDAAQSVTTPAEQRARRAEARAVEALPEPPLRPPVGPTEEFYAERQRESERAGEVEPDIDKARARAEQVGLPLWIDVTEPYEGQRAVASNGVIGAFESPGPGKPLVFMVNGPTFDAEVARLHAAGMDADSATAVAGMGPDDLVMPDLSHLGHLVRDLRIAIDPEGAKAAFGEAVSDRVLAQVGRLTPEEVAQVRKMAEDGNEGAQVVIDYLTAQREDLRVPGLLGPTPGPLAGLASMAARGMGFIGENEAYPEPSPPYYEEPGWPKNGREAGAWAAGLVTGLAYRRHTHGQHGRKVRVLVKFQLDHVDGASVALVAAGVTIAPYRGGDESVTLDLSVPINKGQDGLGIVYPDSTKPRGRD